MEKLDVDSIIFDLDGTLIDSSVPCAKAWNTVLEQEYPETPKVSPRDIADIAGLSRDQIIAAMFPHIELEKRTAIIDKCFVEEQFQIRKDGVVLFDKVTETLHELAEIHPLYIVSNCQDGYIETFLGLTNLHHLFKDHLCFGVTYKPKSHNIRTVIERNNLKKSVYVGDTGGDHKAATDAGIPFIHAKYGFAETSDPCPAIECISELINHIRVPETIS